MTSEDWWDREFGPCALNIMDNPILALDLARSSAPRRATLEVAYMLNQQGGPDYTDEANVF